MVEGPGCKINGEKLQKRVLGQTVVGVAGAVVKKSIQKSRDGASEYDSFYGQKITDVKTLGKELFMFLECEVCLRVHFLMNGSIRFNNEPVWPNNKKEEAMFRLTLTTDTVYFFDTAIDIRSSSESQQKYQDLIDLDICSSTFDFQKAIHTIMEHPSRIISDVILDQLVLPGVGNIIKNEALFIAGINPNSKVEELSEELVSLLVKTNRDFTKIFYQCRRDGRDLRKHMKIYDKSECQECKRRLIRCKIGEYERLTFYCPACQTNSLKLPSKNSLLGWVHLKNTWTCTVCTLENKAGVGRCDACLTLRPQTQTLNRSLQGSPTTPVRNNKRKLEDGGNTLTFKRSPTSGPRHDSHLTGTQSTLPAPSPKHPSVPAPSQGVEASKVVLCPGHKAAATQRKVVKKGDNNGRVFYTCSRPAGQQCKFFMWGDAHHPTCHHGKVSVIRTVLKQNANNGRAFYCCSQPKNKQCDFFQWAEAE